MKDILGFFRFIYFLHYNIVWWKLCKLIYNTLYINIIFCYFSFNVMHINPVFIIQIELYVFISAVKWLIAINRIQNKSFCLHNICV